MSQANTSLDLSEFFSGDDSEGHRLVEFIQKRRGCLKTQNYLFMNYEPQRLSINVQLEKLPTKHDDLCKTGSWSDVRRTDKENSIQQEETSEPASCISERLPAALPVVESKSPMSINRTPAPIVTSCLPQPVCSRRISSRLSSIHKICASPSDRLRRYSLKRLTKIGGGKRTLQQEFESTLGCVSFDPSICSTPQISTKKPISHLDSKKSPETRNFNCCSTPKSSNKNISCCSHTDALIKSLQRKDEELRNYMESVDNTIKSMQCTSQENNRTVNKAVNKTLHSFNSPLKRTYTIEKGNTPGQVVLTPDKTTTNCLVKSIDSQTLASQSKVLNIGEGNVNSLSPSLESDHRIGYNILEVSISKKVQQHEQLPPNPETLPKTPQKINTSLEKEVIPHQLDDTRTSTSIQSAQEVIVMPANEVFRRTCCRENLSGDETNISKAYQLAEDNLLLRDILTDDEDDALGRRILQNSNQAPLNLAHSVKKTVTTKRFKKKELKIDDSQLINLKMETCHSYNTRATKQSRLPLNRAPGVPLNGEDFAKELAKMSNYEILDLRKRNSVGKVFVPSVGRSRRSQEEAIRKKLYLDYQIKNEIIKRNVDSMREKDTSLNNIVDVGAEGNLNENIPVPDEFRDSLAAEENVEINCGHSSIIDANPSDFVSFKMNQSKRKSNNKKKQLPEELKQYLGVSHILSRRRRSLNKSKRSLYSQEQYEILNNQSKENTISEMRSSASKKKSIPYVPSPPKTDDVLITDIRIASPPPPFNTILEKSASQEHKQKAEIELGTILCISNVDVIRNVTSTPPTGHESGSDACNHNNNSNQFTTQSTSVTIEEDINISNENTNVNTNNDMFLFKIPEHPAPRKVVRKQKHKTPTNDLLESITNPHTPDDYGIDSAGETLRRSKRGHVPLKQRPIFQILFEQTMNRCLKYYDDKKRKDKGGAKLRRGRMKKLPTASEQDVVMTSRMEGSSGEKSKMLAKQVNNCEMMEPNENLQDTSLILNTPATVDNVNNVIESRPARHTSQTASSAVLKVKPFKINVARLKSLPSPVARSRCDSKISNFSTISVNSNFELIPWLKSATENDSLTYGAEIFKEMRISGVSTLCFTELQGLEYAFYDTNEKASVGYLRFKPHQIKPRKRAKHFHLHFIVLSGNFRITANNKDSTVNVGDMVAIEKFVYYDIENKTDDIGILMVIKK